MTDFLGRLARGEPIDEPLALVAAHPDDETLGLGAQLRRFRSLTLIHLTDGAPLPEEAAAMPAARAFAALREEELRAALHAAGASEARRRRYGYPDQGSIFHCRAIVERLAEDLLEARLVITHPYEAGHPDHDTAALVVSLACERLRRSAFGTPERFEFASYHLEGGQECYGRFWPDAGFPALRLALSPAEILRKQAALRCFGSQRAVIGRFPRGEEQLRPAPDYDFTRPAPPGAAVYEAWGWELSAARWRALARDALAVERSAPSPCA